MSDLELRVDGARASRAARATRARPSLALVLSLLLLVLLALAAVVPQLLAPYDPLAIAPREAFIPPSLAHPFGTDESGRDVLSRVIQGAGASLLIGVSATAIGLVLGTALGTIAGLGPRLADFTVNRVLEVLFAFPGLLLALLVIVVAGPGPVSATVAVGLSTAPGYARIVRGQLVTIRSSGYVEAGRILGHAPARILLRTILPNTLGPLTVLATLGIGQAIVWAAALSYLGLGAQPPEPEWGAMLSAGRTYLASAWWLTTAPGVVIVLTTLATTVVGRALQASTGGRRAPRASRSSEDRPPVSSEEVASSSTDPASDPSDDRDVVLSVRDLRVGFGGRDVVHGVSFDVRAGECVAIVGESGSGKSVTARALLGLGGSGSDARATTVDLAGTRILGPGGATVSERTLRRLRGTAAGLVLQDALGSLDPVRPVGREIGDALRLHDGRDGRPQRSHAARSRAVVELLAAVGMPDPEERAGRISGELSGGLRQRALIASAIALDPPLLIADEPTTALDVTVQARILELFREQRSRGRALLLISHDLAVVRAVADRIIVMDAGRIVEAGPTEQLLAAPRSPEARRLVAAVPTDVPRGTRLLGDTRAQPRVDAPAPAPTPVPAPVPTVVATGLVKRFGSRVAVDGVDLELRRGETLGLVGESGSGKSTIGRLILGLAAPDEGRVTIDGEPWSVAPERERRSRRSGIGHVAQDPFATFDPRWSVGRHLLDASASASVPELLDRVGLAASTAGRSPRELSGGQRQRVAIARALATDPRILVCDEPVSALDVSIQAQILDLLDDLQDERALSILFISHDLGVVRHVSDRVAVLRDGRVVEEGATELVLRDPEADYTRQLLADAPRLR